MKRILLLAALLPLAAAVRAQTVLPSGAVAPVGAASPATGVIITPGTVPGAQPVVTPGMRDAGSRRSTHRVEKVPGMSQHDRKQLRKLRNVHALPTEDGKIRKQ